MRTDSNGHYKPRKISIVTLRNLCVILAILVELAAFIAFVIVFTNKFLAVRIIVEVLVVFLAIRIVVSKSTPSYKIVWLIFLLIVPFIGFVCYLLFAEDKFTIREKKKLKKVAKEFEKATQSKYYHNVLDDIDPEADPICYNIAKYIYFASGLPIYGQTYTKYYPWGEDVYPVMLEKLKSAKHYIFIEYFIIQEGKMWDSFLEVLKQKVKEGVDVRVMYDDLGCVSTLPISYWKTLESYGIKAMKYAPIRPFLDVRMNNRNHSKIMVIDGHTAFTGGINLADEYINEIVRFGRWKDNAIMVQGMAVFSLTVMFLSAWCLLKNKYDEDYSKYLPAVYRKEIPLIPMDNGYVQAYQCIPYIYESIGQNVYISMCLRAKKYLYITTPYLILDNEMANAIGLAAKSGVDVRIIVPHIPDKKIVFELTRSYYRRLLEDGVRIYEYTPGFIHAKTFVSDDIMATVGTINLDYRSLYLHMENGLFIYKQKSVLEIKEDLVNTLKVSQEVTLEMERKIKWYRRAIRAILRVFAPLM